YDSTLKSLGWDSRGERLYALRATDPSKETRRGIPGADWLAFLGLGFFPVAVVDGRVVTTACHPEWKRSAFRWPLWGRPADRATPASLVADPELVGDRRRRRLEGWRLHDRGILRVLESPIRRSDQGGYGSFGAPTVLADALVGIGEVPVEDAEAVPDLVPARMVNEFTFCPRLFYLEWVHAQFADNVDTVEGRWAHRRIDHPCGDAPTPDGDLDRVRARSVMLSSPRLGL